MKENRLRKLLRKSEPTLGTRTINPWPGLVELIGITEVYDYVEFLSQYGPYDLHDLDNFARAAELFNISSMIKIDQEPRTYLAGRAMASGIQNMLFADIRTVEDAEEAVRAVRAEGFQGISGYRMDRRFGYVNVMVSTKEVVDICNEVVVALMIEKKQAVERLEEILSVKGVDMVQFGSADYALSIGLPGEMNHPKVREAETKTIKTALRFDVPPRVEVLSPKAAEKYIAMGVRNFSIGTDLMILYNWWKEKGENLRGKLSKISIDQ